MIYHTKITNKNTEKKRIRKQGIVFFRSLSGFFETIN